MGFSPNEQVVQERYGQAKSVALPWFDECGIQSSSFDLLKSVVRKYYPIDKKDNDKGLKLIETKFSNTDYWRIADSPFGQAMIYAGLAIHVGINNKWKGMTEAFMGLKDILTWIDNLEESRKDKDTKYMFLNIPSISFVQHQTLQKKSCQPLRKWLHMLRVHLRTKIQQ